MIFPRTDWTSLPKFVWFMITMGFKPKSLRHRWGIPCTCWNVPKGGADVMTGLFLPLKACWNTHLPILAWKNFWPIIKEIKGVKGDFGYWLIWCQPNLPVQCQYWKYWYCHQDFSFGIYYHGHCQQFHFGIVSTWIGIPLGCISRVFTTRNHFWNGCLHWCL